jgi:hypothetical protein
VRLCAMLVATVLSVPTICRGLTRRQPEIRLPVLLRRPRQSRHVRFLIRN